MKKNFLFIIILFSSLEKIQSQENDTLYLSLQDCITMAQQQSSSLLAVRNTLKSKKISHRLSALEILPQISLQADVPGFSRSIAPIIQPDGRTQFIPQSQMSSSLNLSLKQKIPLTGGELSLSSSVSRIDILEKKSTLYSISPISINFSQPLFQPNTIQWEQLTADIEYQIAEKEFSEAVEKIAVDITTQFFECYNAQIDIQNANLNVTLNDTLYKISQGRYRMGKIDENDVLQNEISFLNAKTQKINIELHYERSLGNLKGELKIPSEKNIILIPPQKIRLLKIDSEVALQQATLQRSDIIKNKLQQLKNERTITEAKLSNSFSANLQASVGFNQRAFEVSEKLSPHIMDQQQFSIAIQIPLLYWGKRNLVIEQALIAERDFKEKLEKQKKDFEKEISTHITQLQQAEQKIVFAEKMDTLAQRRFTVAKARYFIGKIDFNQFLTTQRETDEAKRNYQQTLLEYWKEYYQLRYLTLYDFEKNEPIHHSTNFLDK